MPRWLHETIFRRWGKLRDWITLEREFLIWRDGLEDDRRLWAAAPEESKNDALLMGFALAKALTWLRTRDDDLSKAQREFINLSLKRDILERTEEVAAAPAPNRCSDCIRARHCACRIGYVWVDRDGTPTQRGGSATPSRGAKFKNSKICSK